MEEQIYRQPRRNGKTWILVVAAVAVLLLCGVAFVLTANRLSLSVELNGEPEMTLGSGGAAPRPRLTALEGRHVPAGRFGGRSGESR